MYDELYSGAYGIEKIVLITHLQHQIQTYSQIKSTQFLCKQFCQREKI
jgi:hypothetical protein